MCARARASLLRGVWIWNKLCVKGQDENSETYTCANYLFSQMNVVSMCVEFNTIIIID